MPVAGARVDDGAAAPEVARLLALAEYGVLDTPPEPAFDALVELASVLMATPYVAMNLVDDRRTWAKATVGVQQGFAVSRDDAPFCAIAINHPSMITVIEDTLADPRYADNVMTKSGVRFYAGAPLVTPEGHAIGTLCVSDLTPRTPTAEQLSGLATLAAAITAHLELRRKMNDAEDLTIQLRHLASHDALTGLANRRSFDAAIAAAIAHAQRTRSPLCLVLLDLDHFKCFNDTHGHVGGDKLLQVCAKRWKRAVRDTDLLARYGGEEFAVIASGCGLERAVLLAERMQALMPESQTCSGGVTQWRDGESAEDLIRRADALLYTAKNVGGRDAIEFG